jgi:hypothetical protein
VAESDHGRSLEEIENDRWGDPPADATRLISTAYSLRTRPVGALDAEGLRLLISQQIGQDALVPRPWTPTRRSMSFTPTPPNSWPGSPVNALPYHLAVTLSRARSGESKRLVSRPPTPAPGQRRR